MWLHVERGELVGGAGGEPVGLRERAVERVEQPSAASSSGVAAASRSVSASAPSSASTAAPPPGAPGPA
ncbi:hypothetical protein BJF90_19085 [Pseudonocardia sp. CNS-004]|nr:hypothetical protein BJF90_19085 [Pseudonocardia sp. CNS-004]